MKHSCLLALALLAAVSTPAFALDKVRISGTKKTLAKRESSPQTRPRGQTSLTQKMMMYVFSLQRMATEVPAQSTVAWVLIKERKDGRLVEAARGASMVDLPLGREVTLDSTPVELEERDWSGPKQAGSISSSLAGYGLRVVDAAGDVVAECYEPAEMQRIVVWDKPEEKASPQLDELQKKKREERRRLPW
jgi:antitoxin component HigA of HigAB toxin-antitoxin module